MDTDMGQMKDWMLRGKRTRIDVPETRLFDGERFTLTMQSNKKANANKEAERTRPRVKARVVKNPKKSRYRYSVYKKV